MSSAGIRRSETLAGVPQTFRWLAWRPALEACGSHLHWRGAFRPLLLPSEDDERH